ncbi:MAG: DUF5627 domain-containing protein [Prevotellaceae bacterium]|jgi:hypothetical protein|nr:DUF5627 domain-containing protein [Prevotellaceae bacterium]
MKKVFILSLLTLAGLSFSGCQNGDWEFPNYEYSAVYFAYQSPIRTLCLGEDVYDTTLDNLHQCQIMATIGGFYDNPKDVNIGFRVDNSLCNNLVFGDTGADVVAMPSSYYTLSSDNTITIPKGKVLGGVTVQLTDAFFADPKALSTNYVIPVVMTNVAGADSILSGTPRVESPNRTNADDWDVLPKDYILYAVKYINKYDANYLRRGKDVYSGAKTGTNVRHNQYVEKDEVVDDITTRSLNTIAWAYDTRHLTGILDDCTLLLTFDNDGNCSVSSDTEGVTVSGNGKFVSKGDKNSWGNTDRDVLYLDYTLQYQDITCTTNDTLVVRDRGMKAEWITEEAKQ